MALIFPIVYGYWPAMVGQQTGCLENTDLENADLENTDLAI